MSDIFNVSLLLASGIVTIFNNLKRLLTSDDEAETYIHRLILCN